MNLTNSSQEVQPLDPLAFHGSWQAVSLENTYLDSGKTSVLLLFSQKPFNESLFSRTINQQDHFE